MREALADVLDAGRETILSAYIAQLDCIRSPLISDPEVRPQVLAQAGLTITDVVASVRAGRPSLDEGYKLLAWDIGTSRAASRSQPRASLRAATALVEVVLTTARDYLWGRESGAELLDLVMRALTESVTMRIHDASLAYSSQLLQEITDAHVVERRRIARDLHDRVGTGLGVAHQQLELAELYRTTDAAKAYARMDAAHQAIEETMLSLRSISSDLRMDEPVHNLEKALDEYLTTVAPRDVNLRLRVNGDEAWASHAVLEETFLIVREAVRNAIAHGTPTMVLIRVNIAPHQLHGMVEDDGGGFDPLEARESPGMGMTSMRERAELLGGRLAVTAEVGRGTHVELVVPLSEHPSEHRDG